MGQSGRFLHQFEIKILLILNGQTGLFPLLFSAVSVTSVVSGRARAMQPQYSMESFDADDRYGSENSCQL